MVMLVRNGIVHAMEGSAQENVDVLMENGLIVEMRAGIEVPNRAVVIDATGMHVLPGLIDAHTHLGIWEEGVGASSYTGNEDSDPLTPQLRAIDAINPGDESFVWAREGGVTTIANGPGSNNVLSGQFCVMKTAGHSVDEMVFVPYAAQKCAFGENPLSTHGGKGRAPGTRMSVASMLREYLDRAFEYEKKLDQASGCDSSLPVKDYKLEALLPVVRGTVPLKAHVHRADDILTAIRVATEYRVRLTLDHCTEGHLVAAEIAVSGFPAIVGPIAFVAKSKYELRQRSLETPAVLYRAGVQLALTTDATVVPPQYLALSAALACREGLPEHEALLAITLTPAKILGVDHRVGSLAPGKDGDIAIFDGHPFDARSRVVRTIIGGVLVHESRR